MLPVPPAVVQGNTGHLPDAAPLQGMLNRGNRVVVAAHARMTNGDVAELNRGDPTSPLQARDVVVPCNGCLASLTVELKSGAG